MDLQTLLDEKQMTKYRLSQISGVPKTVILDICSGKSSLQKCSARTVQLLAKPLTAPWKILWRWIPPMRTSTLSTDFLKNMSASLAIEDSGQKEDQSLR